MDPIRTGATAESIDWQHRSDFQDGVKRFYARGEGNEGMRYFDAMKTSNRHAGKKPVRVLKDMFDPSTPVQKDGISAGSLSKHHGVRLPASVFPTYKEVR